jgi:hypothetical protein
VLHAIADGWFLRIRFDKRPLACGSKEFHSYRGGFRPQSEIRHEKKMEYRSADG